MQRAAMTSRLASIAVPLVCMLAGCTTLSTARRPADYATVAAAPGDRIEGSLFRSDSAVLSDQDLERILAFEYVAPASSRIALLPFGWSAWSGWSEEMAIATAAIDAEVVRVLSESSRIYDASFLPSILVPETRSVPYLREAAARYQADLLLAFRSDCRSFQRYRLLQSDTTRAWCSVEAVLLDVRTGLVPFVAVATRNFEAAEDDGDLNFRETVLRAELESLADALGDVSRAVRQFVEPDAGV